MISVEYLWNHINQLSRKDHAGYSSTEEFNRDLQTAQEDLYDFYLNIYEQTSRIGEALDPLINKTLLSQTSGAYPLPSDYRQRISVAAEWYTDESCSDSKEYIPVIYNAKNEIRMSQFNSIEKPVLTDQYTWKYTIIDGSIYVYPSELKGRVELFYFQNAPTAERGFTLNTTTQEEEYDAGSTTDLVWPQSETSNFIDILLLYKGVSIKQSELVQYVSAKRNIINQNQ